MIFKETDDHENNADVSHSGQYYNMWNKLAISYKLAAEAIAEKINSEKSEIDLLIYPLVFLYRHYFELRIKEILFCYREFDDTKDLLKRTHKLTENWGRCKDRITIMKQRGLNIQGTSEENLECVDRVIAEIDLYDERSDAFRYPYDKNGNPTLIFFNKIDISNFLSSISSSISVLEEITSMISVTIDFKDLLHSDELDNSSL
ncbi:MULTISPECIES: hypothetical protein [Sphingobacterium]|uniref:hypothetical protein n=1 Tax=Sphingobacterium TaxID=28453 RepID=UPI00257F033D|nr:MULTISPECIES: hypothetical protein [Sphingobacterium]